MIVFLVLSSLGVGFYVALLIALYRDGRTRRQSRVELYRELDFDRASVLVSPRQGTGLTTGGSRQFSDEVLWLPVTKVHWQPTDGIRHNHNLPHSPPNRPTPA